MILFFFKRKECSPSLDLQLLLLEPAVDVIPEQGVGHGGQGDEEDHAGHAHEAPAHAHRGQDPDGGQAHRGAHHMGIDEVPLHLLEHQEQCHKDQRLHGGDHQQQKRTHNAPDEGAHDGDKALGVRVNSKQGIAANANGSMIRVDVFCVDGKYYFVPIYVADVIKKRLPTKAVTRGKSHNEWKEMEDKDFIFSLYSRALISFKSKGGKKVACVDGTSKVVNEEVVYYYGADISTASFGGKAHNGKYEYRGLGIQSLEYLKKHQVDILGNVSEVRREKRMGFH